MEQKLKFKVGDRVRVKSLEWYNDEPKNMYGEIYLNGLSFSENMKKYCGEILTIIKIVEDCYILEGSEFCWQDWMLEDEVIIEDKKEVEQLNKNNMETKEMTKEEVYEYLNNTKILCTSVEETSKLQKKLFELGIKWAGDRNANADDVVNEDAYLLFVEDNNILFDGDISYWVQDENKKIEPSEILAIQLKEEKTKFDPNTLQPFDKVLVKDGGGWRCDYFSHIDEVNWRYPIICVGSCWRFCIPYNDETKQLLGTTDEAPEFYRLD